MAADPAAELRARFLRGFPAIALVIFLSAVDQTIVATALADIAADMGGIEKVSWILIAYLVAATCAAPVFGQLGDFFGRRRLLFVALAIFFVGCAGCALAPNLPSLVMARVIQGFGGGALLTLTQALIGETVPPRERGKFQAWIAGAYGFASAFGPVAGGFITQAFGWRWIFWFLLPLPLVCAYIARRLPDIVPDHAGRRWRFDWLGLALFVLTMGAALVALDRARRFDAAYLPLIIGLVAMALFAGVALLSVERRQPDPLLPLPLFAEASIWRLLMLSILVVAAQVGLISFLPLWLQVVRGLEPAIAGLVLLPIAIGSSFGAFFSGKMVARTGHAMLWPSIGLPVAAAMWSLLAFFAPAMPLWLMLALLGVATFGSGTSYPVVQTTVQAAAGQGRLGIAAAGVAFSRNFGAALGAAVAAAAIFGAMALFTPALTEGFAALVSDLGGLGARLGGDGVAQLRAALAEPFRGLFIIAAVLVGAASVMAWRVPLRRY
ncbi:MAG: MFS transporter [Roseomonas sp.]|jgi:EmrB/QacA subfamily drug resistance transporter|nr:MFS transporter [Roseomonas sp.]MCA3282596.1 MFS transporter [Roseomonas sp.]MCA3296689.1 MFS transporter [Roseomonas sp.]